MDFAAEKIASELKYSGIAVSEADIRFDFENDSGCFPNLCPPVAYLSTADAASSPCAVPPSGATVLPENCRLSGNQFSRF